MAFYLLDIYGVFHAMSVPCLFIAFVCVQYTSISYERTALLKNRMYHTFSINIGEFARPRLKRTDDQIWQCTKYSRNIQHNKDNIAWYSTELITYDA